MMSTERGCNMTTNEEHRQLDVAREVETGARTLAHSTRTVPSPSESYALLGELGATVDHLAQVLEQLSAWHGQAEDGVHYDGEAGGLYGSAEATGKELGDAARTLREASEHITHAHSLNSVVRWFDAPQETKD